MIKLNSKSKKLLLLQRNELLTKTQNLIRKKFGRFLFTNFFINYFQNQDLEKITEELFLKELNTFKNFLPNSVNTIMDIGCGLGIINIYLNKVFEKKPIFFLLDKNRIDRKIKYGFSLNYESYNDLNETKNILLENEINSACVHIFDVERQFQIDKKIDLVISLKSMGYHYPINSYIELFVSQVDKTPNKIAVIFEEKSITYSELDAKSNQFARFIQKHATDNNNALVPILIERSIDMIIAILAVSKLQAAYVPINPFYPARRIRYILDDISPEVLVTSAYCKDCFLDSVFCDINEIVCI